MLFGLILLAGRCRAGHYTNFEGTVSAFEPCFAKAPAVIDAEALFATLAVEDKVHA